jgi:hypothetical protein
VAEEKTKKKDTGREGGKEECEEEVPDNPLYAEEQEPPEDGWFCLKCPKLPCQFVQGQEELERIMDVMNPDLSNEQKRYQFYRYVSRPCHGTLGRGNHRPFPSCIQQGMRDLYPLEKYTGYKYVDESGPEDGSKTYAQKTNRKKALFSSMCNMSCLNNN